MTALRNFPPSPSFAALVVTLATQIADLECTSGTDEENAPLIDAFSATEKALTRKPAEQVGDLLLKVELLARIAEDSVIDADEWKALAGDVERLNGLGMTFDAEAWLRRWTAKGGGYVVTGTNVTFVSPPTLTFQQRLLLDELHLAAGHQAIVDFISGKSATPPVEWTTLRDAFTSAATNLPDGASDAELDTYWKTWWAAMLGEADSAVAIRWKLAQLVNQTAECGEFREDEKLMDAIMADVERHARKGGAA